jgi:hypothetical protein
VDDAENGVHLCCGPQIHLALLPTVEGIVIPLLRCRLPSIEGIRLSGERVITGVIPFNVGVNPILYPTVFGAGMTCRSGRIPSVIQISLFWTTNYPLIC